jgi:hypothetical protein
MSARKKSLAGLSITDAMDDKRLFGPSFNGPSWDAWRTVLRAAFCLPMSAAEHVFFRSVSDRDPPRQRVRELWCIVGRGGGKDSIASLIAAHSAALFDGQHRLRPGERALVQCLACDRDQARIVAGYIKAYFLELPLLKSLVKRETADGLELNNKVDIAIATNSYRSVRGRSQLLTILDECAFFRDDRSVSPDEELYAAIAPGLARIPGSMLCGISTPYRRAGLLFRKFKESYGRDDQDVLVIRAPSQTFNPTLPQAIIDAALATDPAKAKSEWLGEWRDDLSGWASRELIEAAVDAGVVVRPPRSGIHYRAGVDTGGGIRDSFTAATSHAEQIKLPDGTQANVSVLDCVIEIKAPYSTDDATRRICETLKSYGITSVTADRYGANWTVEAFQRYGIRLEHSERDRSKIYQDTLPLFTSGRVRLLDNSRLVNQFCGLERQTFALGRERIDHGPGGMDDLCNAAALSLVLCGTVPWWKREEQTTMDNEEEFQAAKRRFHKKFEPTE